jgi:hypothetical protein
MRCPHCAGEIPQASRYCGICGRSLTLTPAASQPLDRDDEADSLSLFELPAARSARLVRLFVVLALDAMLAVAGVAMIITYINARSDASATPDAGTTAEVQVLPPTPVREQKVDGRIDAP